MPENVVQLELSLVKFESLEHIASEVLLRAADGMRTKLVVRVFDKHDVLTRHVQMMQSLAVRSEAFYQWLPANFHNEPFWRRWVINWRRRRLAVKKLAARNKLIELALDALQATLKSGGPIGLEEYPGAPFRLMRHNEHHELLETARHAKSVWALVFKPNDLLAGENTLVVRAF